MKIDRAILKHYLKNVLFINGTAYAGKSTMVKMLADKHNLIHCGENYHFRHMGAIVTPERQPNLCYFQTMSGWQEFIGRTPDEYEKWILGANLECAELEIAELIHISKDQKVIADTNIPIDILRDIADYNQVAFMLSPQSMSVDQFFERDDADKAFIKAKIMEAENPERAMDNFKACIERTNSKAYYDGFLNSGFFNLIRENSVDDTKAQVLEALEKHFGLI